MYNNNYPNGMQPWNPQMSGHQEADQMKSMCQKYLDYYVVGQMADGSQVEGIVEDMDDNSVTMLVPETVEEDDMMDRIYGGFGGYGGYGHGGRRRFRRFRRHRFPFRAFIFPFIFPFPYYY